MTKPLPCKCGNTHIIRDVYIGKPTMVRLRCSECNFTGNKRNSTEKAIISWNNKLNKQFNGDDMSGRGRPPKLTDERLIKDAIEKTRSYGEAARYLHVSYPTFKKWAKIFNLWDDNKRNIGGKGVPHISKNGRRELKDVLAGKYNGKKLNPTRLKKWLINEFVLEPKCRICGMDEQRITDGERPLVIEFLNGDRTDYRKENLAFLCLNHAFLTVGNIVGRKKEYLYDPNTGEIIEEIKLK